MPTYDYECKKCGTQFAVTASIKEKETLAPKCPKCSAAETFQVFKSLTNVEDMSTGEAPPEMPPGGGMPGMGGMPPGCGGGMCGGYPGMF